MIYRSNDIPEGYTNLAEISDNYVVWVRESVLYNGRDYPAYIQYMTPSIYCVFTDNYRIKTGDTYSFNANYTTNGMYNYLDSYDVEFSLNTISVDDDLVTGDLYDRADAPQIFICQFICVIIFVWVLNQLSKIAKKGGGFGSL